jgi:hypothetical protein
MIWSEHKTNRRYREYLNSPAWKARRRAVLERSGGTCERCRKYPVDEVHHLTYAHFFDEPLEDLQGVCSGCHDFLHKRRGGASDPIDHPDPAEVKRCGELLRRRRIEEERRRRESPDKYLDFRGKVPRDQKEILSMFRKYRGFVGHGRDWRIFSARTTKSSGVALTLQSDWDEDPLKEQLLIQIREMERHMDEGTILLDTERGIWVWTGNCLGYPYLGHPPARARLAANVASRRSRSGGASVAG